MALAEKGKWMIHLAIALLPLQAAPATKSAGVVSLTLAGPAWKRYGVAEATVLYARFTLKARNGSQDRVLICTAPGRIGVVQASKGVRVFDPSGNDEVRGMMLSDWVLLTPGKSLSLPWYERVRLGARGVFDVYGVISTPRLADLDSYWRPKVQRMLLAKKARLGTETRSRSTRLRLP